MARAAPRPGRTLRHFAGVPGASCKIGQMLAKLRAHFHQ
jgi:hypothetical protein